MTDVQLTGHAVWQFRPRWSRPASNLRHARLTGGEVAAESALVTLSDTPSLRPETGPSQHLFSLPQHRSALLGGDRSLQLRLVHVRASLDV
jgi:hypothetical protein